jgi:hypothetical protein
VRFARRQALWLAPREKIEHVKRTDPINSEGCLHHPVSVSTCLKRQSFQVDAYIILVQLGQIFTHFRSLIFYPLLCLLIA